MLRFTSCYDFGKAGRIYREADEEAAELATVVDDIIAGQYSNPYRVIAFNTGQGWARDATADVARDVRARALRDDTPLRGVARRFVERVTGENVQSTGHAILFTGGCYKARVFSNLSDWLLETWDLLLMGRTGFPLSTAILLGRIALICVTVSAPSVIAMYGYKAARRQGNVSERNDEDQ